MNDNKDEVMNYSYIFAKDIFEYNQRKGKMEYFDARFKFNCKQKLMMVNIIF